MNEERCETCRFWAADPSNGDVGDCCRYPPVAISAEEMALVYQPDVGEVGASNRRLDFWTHLTTHASSWCGEHQPRKTLPMAEERAA